jgi:hypothetical protein
LNGLCSFLGDKIEKKKKESLVGENQSRHFQQHDKRVFFFLLLRGAAHVSLKDKIIHDQLDNIKESKLKRLKKKKKKKNLKHKIQNFCF